MSSRPGHGLSQPALMLGAIGVVYGDIGTSPIYAMQTVFSIDGGIVRPNALDIYGVISLVFWSIILIVTLKYVVFILRADNDGEGGILALATLTRKGLGPRVRTASVATILGIIGASLFYGDSVITPAISVLSAVEGLSIPMPSLAPYEVMLGAVIILGLFAAQRLGTGAVGKFFGPIMVVWFLVLGGLGLARCSATRRSSRPCCPRTPSSSSSTVPSSRSSPWGRSSSRSPAPRRSTPTWATSAPGPSGRPGSSSPFPA